MFKGKVLLFSLLLVLATSLYAGDVDNCESECAVSCVGMRVSICPAGDFEFISAGCGGDSDYIEVYVRDAGGLGIANIPWTDYWLNACDPAEELCLCANAVVADSLTNDEGRTTISGRIAGGGCITTGGVYLAVQGKQLLAKPDCLDPICMAMIIVSPDLTADCEVTLSDLGVFGLSYNKALGDAGYNTCCDFNDDDQCNLSDFAFMGEHYLHECF
ncbi:MAG: hypothetical protein JW876_04335 [Candidatus Krumholzibacteriota bacterium]|nr:hypothetical protein [Candidatus Krumholzibacteriota bacterium]